MEASFICRALNASLLLSYVECRRQGGFSNGTLPPRVFTKQFPIRPAVSNVCSISKTSRECSYILFRV